MGGFREKFESSIAVITFLLVVLASFFIFNNKDKNTESYSNGLFVDMDKREVVSLEGPMEFYWKKLYTPNDFHRLNIEEADTLFFPDPWNGNIVNEKELQGKGYSTFRTNLFFDSLQPLAILIDDYCNSFKLWINGELVAKSGSVGRNYASTKSVKVNSIAYFTPRKGSNEFVLQTANYDEKYGGFRQAFLIGTEDKIVQKRNDVQVIDTLVLGFLLTTFLYYLGLFIFVPSEKSLLYFSLLVFFIFLRQLLLGHAGIMDEWINTHVHFYLKTTIAAALASSLMVFFVFRSVFPKFMARKVFNIYRGFMLIFLVFTFIFPIYHVSVGMHYIQIVVLGSMTYIFYLALRAFRKADKEKRLIALGMILFLITVVLEALIFNRQISTEYILHYGLVVFIVFESYAFGVKLSKTYQQNVNLNKQLEFQNKNLQRLVDEKTTEIVEAKERELFSAMLQKSSADKFLLQLKDDLSKLKIDNRKDDKKLIDIMKSLELSVEHEELDNHLLHFEKIHPHFFEVLQEQNPDLTQNELKLCAYLKLNLSYKDIANILHVQPESVRKAKSRMRRKMGLSSDGQVLDYLLAIKTG